MNAKPLKNRESVIQALRDFDGTVVQICGHSHCDYAFEDGDETYSPWLTVFRNMQRCSRRRQSDLGKITVGQTGPFLSPTRTPGTMSEDCWDVVVVRPGSGKINFVRFGAGRDREFSFPPQARMTGSQDDGRHPRTDGGAIPAADASADREANGPDQAGMSGRETRRRFLRRN